MVDGYMEDILINKNEIKKLRIKLETWLILKDKNSIYSQTPAGQEALNVLMNTAKASKKALIVKHDGVDEFIITWDWETKWFKEGIIDRTEKA